MHPTPANKKTSTLTLAALGVVYGDIGTSPLYAFKEAFHGSHAMAVTETNILAALSAFFWAVMLIISIKYVWIVLRFNNEGEGGVLALTALAQRVTRSKPLLANTVIISGIFAAALFYGDAIITPAISVLSAIEGLSVATPQFEHWIEPITIGILLGLFIIQKQGTSRIGRYFGPITVIWFVTLGVLGINSILQTPAVLQALNPLLAIQFAIAEPGMAFILMSAVFLALTGGEALYADMGHFGARPVRLAWYGLVWPALMLNYFGQGALILRTPEAAQNPFYFLAPDWFMLVLVAMATAATVIASQATITGAYSMTLQASRLGYLPRVQVSHTSDTEKGQIYIPLINWAMLIGVIILVMEFKTSGELAAAYGIAVSGTMIITTFLALIIASTMGKTARIAGFIILPLFMMLELVFFSSNLTKFFSGGWLPMVLGGVIFTLLITWKKGSKALAKSRNQIDIKITAFLENSFADVPRVAGTAIYLTSDPSLVPSALFHSLKHFKVMHAQTIFLHVVTEDVPYINAEERLRVEKLADQVYSVRVRFGFRQEPRILKALSGLDTFGISFNPMQSTFFVTRSSIVDGPGKLPLWQCGLFSWMNRQSAGVASYFGLPPNTVVELGTQTSL